MSITPPEATEDPAVTLTLLDKITNAVETGNGCLMAAAPAIVFRGTYAGRNIVGPNSTYSAENTDDRGYVPVEWWVMSKTVALNPICLKNEGITSLQIGSDEAVRFDEAVRVAAKLLLGEYEKRWPLTKVLDIGGEMVKPNFIPGDITSVRDSLLRSAVNPAQANQLVNKVITGGCDNNKLDNSDINESESMPTGEAYNTDNESEVGHIGEQQQQHHQQQQQQQQSVRKNQNPELECPPIPCHVHCGDYGGNGSGKLEAYFFPPLDVPPYNLNVKSVKTRLGLKPKVSKEEVVAAMKRFGVDDSMYQLLNEFVVKPRETWTIPTHVIHAPGPWTTFEIQLPQDDFNLFAWQLGQKVDDPIERRRIQKEFQLRGYSNEKELLEASLKWPLNVDPNFEKRWRHDCEVLESGAWGRRLRLFYHEFYGEGFEIFPGQTFRRESSNKPYAGITWSGTGHLNEVHKLNMDQPSQREFLVTPGTSISILNTGDIPLLIYCVFPFDLDAPLSTTEIERLIQGSAGHGGHCGC